MNGASTSAGPETRIIWLILALLLAARALLSFVPTMWAWSLNLQRFIHPALGWGLWSIAALALVPPLARRAAPWLDYAGDLFSRRPALAATAAATAAATLVGVLPDQVRFVGDFLLRQGTVREGEKPAVLFPQALPLDVFLHYSFPRYLTDSALVDANGAARVIGMLEAALLAALAVAFARALALRGAPALVAAALVFFGGYLGIFTGFSKAFAEMCLLVAVLGVCGIRALRDGKGLLPVGLALAVGVTLHRSALGLAPAVALVFAGWFRRHGRHGGWKRPGVMVALAAPLTALAVMVPRIAAVVARWDAVHFAPPGIERQGGVLGAVFAGSRPADMLNLLAMLSPLALLVPALVLARRGRPPAGGAGGELAVLAAIALPFLVVLPFIHPVQGLFRDWDDFAATGVAVSLLVAWWVGRTLRAQPAWLAVALTMNVAAPTVQWLAHHRDLERGFLRVRSFLLEPPRRAEPERASAWDYLGIYSFNLERWDAAAEAFSHAAETSPSPRILQEWALVETMRGNYRMAQQLYHRMLVKMPENALGWLGLATVSIRADDLPEATQAARALLALQPGNPDAMQVLEEIARRQDAAAGRPRGPADRAAPRDRP